MDMKNAFEAELAELSLACMPDYAVIDAYNKILTRANELYNTENSDPNRITAAATIALRFNNEMVNRNLSRSIPS